MKNDVNIVCRNNLCMGCGSCFCVCPNNAISLRKDTGYIPRIDKSLCNHCAMCLAVCPGNNIDYTKIASLNLDGDHYTKILGHYQSCYDGFACNEEIRFNSSSGGVVTAVLLALIEEKIIDGAIVTRFNKENPLEPEPFVARNKDEILMASGSKYCPVPVNAIVKQVFSRDERLAYVGLPCHIAGLRKLELLRPELKKRIIYKFGLFCGMVRSFQATQNLLEGLQIKLDSVINFKYRGSGWPGFMEIEMLGGKIIKIPLNVYYPYLSKVYLLNRCLLCSDLTAELSDISFGDAWHLKYSSNIGHSFIVTRTKEGDRILELLNKRRIVSINNIPASSLNSLVIPGIISKKRSLGARILIWRLLCKKIPIIDGQILFHPGLHDYITTIELLITRFIFCIKFLRPILKLRKCYNYIVLSDYLRHIKL